MIKKKIEDAINEQINEEYYSAYLYLSMSAYFESIDLPGCANWMKIQYKEEITHVLKFFNFLNERGGRVLLKGIEAPQIEWKSTLDAFEFTLKHEEHVTELINNLADLALSERDHATSNFLQWYIEEQVEEESTVGTIISQVKMLKDAPHLMFQLDKELGARVFVDHTQQK